MRWRAASSRRTPARRSGRGAACRSSTGRRSHAGLRGPRRRHDWSRGRVQGGFISGWLRAGADPNVHDVLRYAHGVAALNCRGLGARDALPRPAEVTELIRDEGMRSNFARFARSKFLSSLCLPMLYPLSSRIALQRQAASRPVAWRGASDDHGRRRRPGPAVPRGRRDQRLRRAGRAAPPAGVSGVLSLREQSRGRERSRAGRVPACLSRPAHLQREFGLQYLAVSCRVNVCLNRVSAKQATTEPLDQRELGDVRVENCRIARCCGRNRRPPFAPRLPGCRKNSAPR